MEKPKVSIVVSGTRIGRDLLGNGQTIQEAVANIAKQLKLISAEDGVGLHRWKVNVEIDEVKKEIGLD